VKGKAARYFKKLIHQSPTSPSLPPLKKGGRETEFQHIVTEETQKKKGGNKILKTKVKIRSNIAHAAKLGQRGEIEHQRRT